MNRKMVSACCVYFVMALSLVFGNGCAQKPVEKAQSQEMQELTQAIHEQLPPPPENFSWVLFRGVALLHPIAWHEYQKSGTYCSSVESVEEKGAFETGVTLQVFRDVKQQHKVTPKDLASALILDLYKNKENSKLFLKENKHPDSETIVYRYKNVSENLPPIIVHKYFIINPTEDYVNVVTFETTEEKWEQYWEKEGKTILGQVGAIPYF